MFDSGKTFHHSLIFASEPTFIVRHSKVSFFLKYTTRLEIFVTVEHSSLFVRNICDEEKFYKSAISYIIKVIHFMAFYC